MKQAIKTTEVTKASSLLTTSTPKTHKPNKTEPVNSATEAKTNQLNRFLEASCDCV